MAVAVAVVVLMTVGVEINRPPHALHIKWLRDCDSTVGGAAYHTPLITNVQSLILGNKMITNAQHP